MRITCSMMMNEMIYWTARQKELLNDASIVVSSGKRINRPSDNPAATAEILDDRVTISAYGQYQSNIDIAETWIETSNTTLDTVYYLLAEAKELFSSQSSQDDDSNVDYTDTLQQIYEQILGYANSTYGSGYLYSGDQNTVLPFANSVGISEGVPSDVVFDLAEDASELTIEITDSTAAVVRILTASGGVEGTNTLNWDGCDEDGDLLSDGDYNFIVSATNADGDAVASYPSYRGDEGGKEVITDEGNVITLNNNGGEIFSKALKVLSQALAAIANTDGGVELDSSLGNALDEAIAQIETEQVNLANVNSQLTYADDRLDQLTEFLKERASDLETGSTEEAAIELQTQETAYETTLEVAATLLKMPKLSDYL